MQGLNSARGKHVVDTDHWESAVEGRLRLFIASPHGVTEGSAELTVRSRPRHRVQIAAEDDRATVDCSAGPPGTEQRLDLPLPFSGGQAQMSCHDLQRSTGVSDFHPQGVARFGRAWGPLGQRTGTVNPQRVLAEDRVCLLLIWTHLREEFKHLFEHVCRNPYPVIRHSHDGRVFSVLDTDMNASAIGGVFGGVVQQV
nr:hypothetical protein [Candidatus Laterigemmans baculatus]